MIGFLVVLLACAVVAGVIIHVVRYEDGDALSVSQDDDLADLLEGDQSCDCESCCAECDEELP